MADPISTLIGFVASLIVSTVIIYIITKLFGEEEGIGTAFLAALIGSIVYAGAYYFLGGGIIASILGGIVWLIVLGTLYKMGWIKSFVIALIVWIIAALVGFLLPTAPGPL